MQRIQRFVLVHHGAEQMFDLVADVESYPAFLPWCVASRVVADHEGGVDANLQISFGGIRTGFTTRNALRYPEQIRIDLLDGPFRTLTGQWQFLALRAGACKVQLTLQYEFAAGMLGRAVAPAFNRIADSLVDSFARRADELHGPV